LEKLSPPPYLKVIGALNFLGGSLYRSGSVINWPLGSKSVIQFRYTDPQKICTNPEHWFLIWKKKFTSVGCDQAVWKVVGAHSFLILGFGDGTVEFRLLPALQSIISLKSHTKGSDYSSQIAPKCSIINFYNLASLV
jgi:hypothetical protein